MQEPTVGTGTVVRSPDDAPDASSEEPQRRQRERSGIWESRPAFRRTVRGQAMAPSEATRYMSRCRKMAITDGGEDWAPLCHLTDRRVLSPPDAL